MSILDNLLLEITDKDKSSLRIFKEEETQEETMDYTQGDTNDTDDNSNSNVPNSEPSPTTPDNTADDVNIQKQEDTPDYGDDSNKEPDAPTDYNIPETNTDPEPSAPPADGGEETTDYGAEANDAGDAPMPEEGDGETTDYGAEDGSGEETPSDEGEDNNDTSSDTSSSSSNELIELENEILATLTPQELAMRNTELYNNFIEVYDSIDSIINRIYDIPKNEDNIKVISLINKELQKLKEHINTYMIYVYKTKTYIENLISYQLILSILNQINEILKNLDPKD